MFVSANKFCGCWLKKFWSIRKALPFATPSRFRKHERVLPRADRQRLKPCLRRPLNHQVIYCVRGVYTPPRVIRCESEAEYSARTRRIVKALRQELGPPQFEGEPQ